MKSLHSFKKNFILHFDWSCFIEAKQKSLSCSPALFKKKFKSVLILKDSVECNPEKYSMPCYFRLVPWTLLFVSLEKKWFIMFLRQWDIISVKHTDRASYSFVIRIARAWNTLHVFPRFFINLFTVFTWQKSPNEHVYLL